ncbi:hypothetical protein BD311DRAFT_604917, partial [Dichomitus squalens]
MCARYSQAIQDLAKAEQGWHFGAMHTQPEQLRDFKIEDMANTMQMVAPELWSLRTVVILSILMQSRDPRCNALQSTMGIFLHSCNAPEKLTKVLSRMGISISLSSIHRAVHSLSRRSCQDIQLLGRSLLNSYALDNFDVLLKVLIHTTDGAQGGLVHLTSAALFQLQQVTLEDLRCSKLVWERSDLNPHATNPPALNLPTDPDPVDPIPLTKTHYLPLRAMDINQSTVAGNLRALSDMYKQAGVGDPRNQFEGEPPLADIAEYITIVFGDLGTYERFMSALRRRSVERTPYDRCQSVAFGIGYFHVKMAATDTVWRLVVNPTNARQDDTSFMKTAGELRPNESSRLVSGATFRQQHELIGHVGILLRLDAWRTEVKRRNPSIKSLEAWAETKPSLAEIEDVAEALVRDYVEGEGLDLFALAAQAEDTRDQIRENTMRLQNYLLLYEELSYAMNAGDIGRLESLLALWIPLFRAAGKHKYGNYTLRFMHDLFQVYPEGLRQAIRMNILVNPTGQPHEFR